jgi:hypothetical protein
MQPQPASLPACRNTHSTKQTPFLENQQKKKKKKKTSEQDPSFTRQNPKQPEFHK